MSPEGGLKALQNKAKKFLDLALFWSSRTTWTFFGPIFSLKIAPKKVQVVLEDQKRARSKKYVAWWCEPLVTLQGHSKIFDSCSFMAKFGCWFWNFHTMNYDTQGCPGVLISCFGSLAGYRLHLDQVLSKFKIFLWTGRITDSCSNC